MKANPHKIALINKKYITLEDVIIFVTCLEVKMSNNIVYTIGHGNLELPEFLRLLKKYDIEVLVDVRSVPLSKYVPQYNVKNIREELKKAGIEYVFLEDEHIGNLLGGRPKVEDCYDDNGQIIYSEVMQKAWYQEGLSRLIDIAKIRKTVIMCSEEDPNRCHRHRLITQTVLSNGMGVFHIRKNGIVEKAKNEKIQMALTQYGGL